MRGRFRDALFVLFALACGVPASAQTPAPTTARGLAPAWTTSEDLVKRSSCAFRLDAAGIDKTGATTTALHEVASDETAQKRIAAGQPIFRQTPGPPGLAADVLRLFRPNVDAATHARRARTDPLLAMMVQARAAKRR